MILFEIIPADFFSVLVSPNREIYAEALMKLYEMFRTEINIRLKSFLAEVEILLEDREYILEEGDEAEDMEPSSLRGKARLIVRRFVKTGWIDREFLDGSFTEIIIPNSYAITMMCMLKELTDEGVAEYDSLVFSTYSALNQAYTDSRGRMYAELLQGIGISRYPEPLELRGSVVINGNDMGVFQSGFCLYSAEIDLVNITIPDTVTKMLTIENRANFFAHQQADDELVIYHGGHYSPSKKKLFEKIAAAMPKNSTWLHWGDIDLGGFRMLLRLRTEILPTVQPYRMNIPELQAYRDFTQPFSGDYAEKLQKLSEAALLSDCKASIDYMLTQKIRLEQEAMLT